jgi:cytochrome bd-type quinol oxidase subunit 2
MIFEDSITPGVIALVLVFLLGAGAVIALVASALAVLVLGPRRPDAMTLPAGSAFVASVGYVLLSGGRVSPLPSAIVVGVLVAFVITWLQRDSLDGRDHRAQQAARVIRIVGSVLAWLLGGLAIGLVIGAAAQSAFPLLLFPLIGVLIGLRSAVVLDRNAARANASQDPEETPRSAGILDE